MELIPFILLAAGNAIQVLVVRTIQRRLKRLEKAHLSSMDAHIKLQKSVLVQAFAHRDLKEATHKLANVVHERGFPAEGMGKSVN